MRLQALVEHVLADVAERRVAQVVAERDRLGQVLVEAERAGHVAGDAAGLERVGQPGAVVVALGGDEHLRLVLEPAEGLGVDDPVAVAHERRAVGRVGLWPGPERRVGRRGLERGWSATDATARSCQPPEGPPGSETPRIAA